MSINWIPSFKRWRNPSYESKIAKEKEAEPKFKFSELHYIALLPDDCWIWYKYKDMHAIYIAMSVVKLMVSVEHCGFQPWSSNLRKKAYNIFMYILYIMCVCV